MLVNNQLCIYGKSALLCQNNGFPHLHFSEKPLCHLACHPLPCYLRDDENRFSFVLLPSCLVLLAACSPAPSDRIAENMPAYEQLPKEHQAKVARGELEKGMSPMAVLLAWGEPEQKMAGRMNGKNTERWIYTRSGTGWSLGLGGGGFRGRDSGIGTGIGVTMPLGSRPPVSCNVLFEDGKVIGWEAVNGF